MGITKKEVFSDEQNFKAKLFKALGHPARIAIIEMLMAKETCICTEMVEDLPLSQSTISQHLKELKEAGIIKGKIDGQKICYCIDADFWNDAHQQLHVFFNKFQEIKSCC